VVRSVSIESCREAGVSSPQDPQLQEGPAPGPSGEAFPAAVEPPWRRRRSLLATVSVPSTLVGAGIVTLILVLRTPGSHREEHAELASETVPEPPRSLGEAVVPDTEVEAGTGDADCGGEGGEIWGEEDLEEGDSGPGPDASLGETVVEDSVESIEDLDAEPASARPPGGSIVFEGTIGSGSTVVGRLTKHGLTRAEANEVVDALDGLYDFRRSQPGHRYVLELGGSERAVQRFRYEAGPTDVFEVSLRAGRLAGKRIKVDTTLRRMRVGKRSDGSLSDTISGAGLSQQVTRVFMRTFGADINFQNDQRTGDTLKVILDEEFLEGKNLGYKTIWALEYAGQVIGRRRAFYFAGPGERGRYYDEKGESLERTRLRTPCTYNRISSAFDPNRLHPILRRRVPHNGVDFAAPRGTPVWATADGTVTYLGRKGASGNLVIIKHAGNLESVYAHLQSFARGLKRGEDVEQGQLIGTVGSTGRSTGPHLHFGLRKNGRFIDPQRYRSGPGQAVNPRYMAQFSAQTRRLATELQAIKIR